MKKTILAMSLVLSTSVSAETVTAVVQDHYRDVIRQVPYSVEVCREVAVRGDRTSDTVKGAIIGGIIGHQIGNGRQQDQNREIGAVLGGIIGHERSTAQDGYRTQCRVETRYNEEVTTVYSYSTITFNGRTVRFKK